MITRPCDTCGTSVTRRPAHFREHVYCSAACYWARRAPSGRQTVACTHCGTALSKQACEVRDRNFCNRRCYDAFRRHDRKPNSSGYTLVYVGEGVPGTSKSGHMLEHRWVMQQQIGRPLLAEENVHHLNGDRTDNRPENLELWTTSQPPGQRVADKVAWAKEILALYGEG